MGYPRNFRIPVSDTQAYRQFGNAVVVPVVEDIAQQMVEQRIIDVALGSIGSDSFRNEHQNPCNYRS